MAKPKKKHFDTKNEKSLDNVKSIGVKKRFSPHDLIHMKPKNAKQTEFLKSFFSGTPAHVLHGAAGTGKTFLAVYAALSVVFDQSTPYHKVCIFRSAVEGRKIGFLPGTEEEKMAQYEQPYRELVGDLVRYGTGYDVAAQLGLIEFRSTSFIRGRTIDNAVIIVDEAQNMDYDELKSLFTRVGENCIIIFCGDDAQDDLKRNREQSGFLKLRAVLAKMREEDVNMIEFTMDDCVRSGIIRQFLIAESTLGF